MFYQTNESVAKLIGYLLVMMLLKTRLEIVGVVFLLLMIDQSISSKQQKNPDDLSVTKNTKFYCIL
jgi:hypothetical protein